jgi:hypothetical protein
MPPEFLSRPAAGAYLKAKYGFASAKTLGKLPTVGGGPPFHKCGKTVLYAPAALDSWALARSARRKPRPRRTSARQRRRAIQIGRADARVSARRRLKPTRPRDHKKLPGRLRRPGEGRSENHDAFYRIAIRYSSRQRFWQAARRARSRLR